ncbi:hypothetical protein PC39_02335 [Salinisphaera sp. PC39]|uniref:DUF4160 domain-containing protein n=1 Tax=Salinisphaera sp. PC39 TaxID=1304156 RepID=UPI00333FC563
MPTALRSGPYRLFFYSNENAEPPHIHIQRDEAVAKFWLRPVSLAGNVGFASHELTRIRRIVTKYESHLMRAWHEFFGI